MLTTHDSMGSISNSDAGVAGGGFAKDPGVILDTETVSVKDGVISEPLLCVVRSGADGRASGICGIEVGVEDGVTAGVIIILVDIWVGVPELPGLELPEQSGFCFGDAI